jgi:hypothetical protein
MSKVKKSFRKKVYESFLTHPEGVITAKPIEESGRRLSNILDIARLYAFDMGLVQLNPTAERIVKQTKDVSGLRRPDLYGELMKLNVALYSYWGNTFATPTRGVFHAFKRDYGPHLDEFGWKSVVENDLPYWQSSRVFGHFIVLFERPDGTVLVSEDYKRVYLVLGLAQSIAEVVYPIINQRSGKYPPPPFHGPLIGMKCMMTLLNWEGKIVYDGLLAPIEKVPTKHLKNAVNAYVKAVNTKQILTQLEKKPISFDLNPTDAGLKKVEAGEVPEEETRDDIIEIESIRMSMRSELARIKATKSRTLQEMSQTIVFRRFGYTERENPEHMIGLMCGGTPLHVDQTQSLIPTAAEYINIILKVIDMMNEKPSYIAIDAKEVLKIMQKLLDPVGIKVSYYPPPSAEETMMNNMTNPHLSAQEKLPSCAVCHTTSCADGKKLLLCARCHGVYYCGKEHQKQHWSQHKKRCGK